MLADKSDGYLTICPYCDAKFGDSWEDNASEEPNERECEKCGKTFIQWADYSVDYCTAKVEDGDEE